MSPSFPLALALVSAFAAPSPRRPSPDATFVGRANELHVRIPRVSADSANVVIDGDLSEPVWQRAALLTGFSQFAPQDGVPASDSTHVLLWYSPTALYVGIRAFEAHGPPHASLADRDKISADDNVQLLIGTFHDQRQAYVFAVNPLGIQMDGTIVETTVSGGGWTPTLSGRTAPDLSQDFVFASKGRVTEYGYEVELRIPFKSLKYQSSDVQSWDFNVVREVQHSGFEDSWAPAKRSSSSFLGQSGSLDELSGFDRGLVLDVNPFVTRKSTGAPSPAGWRYESTRPQLGTNVRWGITNNLTLNGTVRPDFAEVESDAGQFVIDPRQALFFPEKRPFFLDGLEQFSVPNNLIYTRRIAKPELATKITGKMAGTNIGFLSANDDPSLSFNGRYQTTYNILRAQRDVGDQSRIGMAYTDRAVGGDYNRVADVDGRLLFAQVWNGSFQYAESFDKTHDVAVNAPLWSGTLARNGKRLGLRYSLSGISDKFITTSGFISRNGIVHGAADQRGTWFNERGKLFETLTGDILYDDTWQYTHFTRHGDAQDKKFHLSGSAGLRGGWTTGLGVYWETFGYDTQLYRSYQIERTVGATVDTVPFVGVGRIPNRDYVFTLATPQWSRFNATMLYVGGQDENFFEWAQANIDYLSTALTFRPTDRIRLTGNFDYQDYWRRSDGSLAGRNMIPRLKAEYQLTRSMFLRLVGEYDLSEHSDLRDETRTFFPLIINGQKAIAMRSGTVRGDYLFSYQPNPGTVFFVGYGSRADGPPDPNERFTFQPLIRSSDYFFVKYSYLFRF
ncbi:MAG TPA: DUF5916 domain-containing protein [Gemmatimonadaceae bacterium]|nr:DUF5916 domain-containing protein [Gemmatimonadaceae bacterium]